MAIKNGRKVYRYVYPCRYSYALGEKSGSCTLRCTRTRFWWTLNNEVSMQFEFASCSFCQRRDSSPSVLRLSDFIFIPVRTTRYFALQFSSLQFVSAYNSAGKFWKIFKIFHVNVIYVHRDKGTTFFLFAERTVLGVRIFSVKKFWFFIVLSCYLLSRVT